jgi:hypothetical protein
MPGRTKLNARQREVLQRIESGTAPVTSREPVLAPADLVAQLSAAGGTLRISDPDPTARSAWRRSVQAAIRSGQHLHHTGRTRRDIVITLAPADPRPGADTEPTHAAAGTKPGPATPRSHGSSLSRSNRPDRRAHLSHPLAVHLNALCAAATESGERTERPDLHLPAVPPDGMPRVLRILDALFRMAEQRGHLALPASQADRLGRRHLSLRVDGEEYPLTITDYHGMLALRLLGSPKRRRTWNDTRRLALEDRLAEVIDWCQSCSALIERHRYDLALMNTAQNETLNAARERARAAFIQDRHRDALRQQTDGWRLAGEIRALCAARRAQTPPGQFPDGATAAWLTWAANLADRIDPLNGPPHLPRVREPTPDQLADYLAQDPAYSMEDDE